jgi:hypothetical protein
MAVGVFSCSRQSFLCPLIYKNKKIDLLKTGIKGLFLFKIYRNFRKIFRCNPLNLCFNSHEHHFMRLNFLTHNYWMEEFFMMNTRERFHAIRHFEPFDRIPYHCDGIFASALHRWVKEGMPIEAIPNRKGEHGEIFPGYTSLPKYFGCDESTGPGLSLNFNIMPPYEYIEYERDEYTITARTPIGIKTKRFVGQEDSMHHFLDHPVKTREDWPDMKRRYQFAAERLPADWSDELANQLNNATHPIGTGMNGIYWTLRDWMGAERHMMMFYDDPDLVCDMMDTLIDLWIAVLTPIIRKVKIDRIGISEDMAYKCGPLISPELFRKYMSPRYRRFVDFLSKYGDTGICIDCDGLIDKLIPCYLDCGIHEFTPMEVVCGNDPYAIRAQYGKEVVLYGCYDKMAMAAGHDAIDREWERLWPLVEGGGFFPSVDHAVPADVSFDNFCYYMKRKRQLIGVE